MACPLPGKWRCRSAGLIAEAAERSRNGMQGVQPLRSQVSEIGLSEQTPDGIRRSVDLDSRFRLDGAQQRRARRQTVEGDSRRVRLQAKGAPDQVVGKREFASIS